MNRSLSRCFPLCTVGFQCFWSAWSGAKRVSVRTAAITHLYDSHEKLCILATQEKCTTTGGYQCMTVIGLVVNKTMSGRFLVNLSKFGLFRLSGKQRGNSSIVQSTAVFIECLLSVAEQYRSKAVRFTLLSFFHPVTSLSAKNANFLNHLLETLRNVVVPFHAVTATRTRAFNFQKSYKSKMVHIICALCSKTSNVIW